MARVVGSLYKILTKPKLLSPHLRVDRFSDLNLQELKRLGIEYLAIDKDSTLTQH
jgi:predicted HAD superfamily phosphohydrolase YqeG